MPGIIPEKLKRILEKQQYRFAGRHSAVKICEWTKKSLRDEDYCYKQKFYGIKSHLCCQMSPAVNFCDHQCVFCWRPQEFNLDINTKLDDNPSEIIEKCIESQRKLLSGFGGNEKVNKQKLKEAQDPGMFAISLSGEPSLYPKLGELINELHKRKITSFLVSNGTFPENLKKLIGKAEPTQLYITLPAPDEDIYKKICKPIIKNGWKKIQESLELISEFKCRKVIRLTLVNYITMICPEKYAGILNNLDVDYVEVKGYVWVGFSRLRLKEENMPSHEEIRDFAEQICENSGFEILDEKKESRVVLLGKTNRKNRKINL
ncbi:4-demethylwyosine synthase TYW1 [Candidatus Woesearchaeota archaeon]|nr:4-demethylwyosine synthase TYW1 [Candidatus Woesearchaeota archaeon]